MDMFVVQNPFIDGDILGVYDSFENAKQIVDQISEEYNQYLVILKVSLNQLDNRNVLKKEVYSRHEDLNKPLKMITKTTEIHEESTNIYVVQTPLSDGDVIGVYESFENAKQLADTFTEKHNEFVVIFNFKLNQLNLQHVKDKIVYETTIETQIGPGGLSVYNVKY